MWEQIQANKRRSMMLITAMAIALLLIGWLFGILIAGTDGAFFGLIIAVVIWMVMMLIYFSGGGEALLLRGAGAKEVTKEDSPRLYNVVEEMTIASGLGFMPKIYIIDDPAPNAFAIGRKPESSSVAVTTGLMHRLNRDELQGVIAHEIAHLKNQDVKFMTLAAVLLGTIVILAEMVLWLVLFGARARSRSRSRGGQAEALIMLAALLVAILGPIMAQLLYLACSRRREYVADACGAQFTRYPEGLAAALEKISQWRGQTTFASKATAPMFIVNPLAASGSGGSLFATHPPTEERIRILRNMAGAGLGDYEAAFRQAKGSTLISASSLQQSPHIEPRAPSNEGPIEARHETRNMIYRANGYLHMTCSCGLELQVPENYERKEVNCIRCGSVLPVPAAQEIKAGAKGATPPPLGPLQYTRLTQGWESFRCACGHTIQLSPVFALPQINCPKCRRQIKILYGA